MDDTPPPPPPKDVPRSRNVTRESKFTEQLGEDTTYSGSQLGKWVSSLHPVALWNKIWQQSRAEIIQEDFEAANKSSASKLKGLKRARSTFALTPANKQQKLSKRVSNLELQLAQARKELDTALLEASPMSNVRPRYERFTPSHTTLKRPRFLPGKLPTLPSESVLMPPLPRKIEPKSITPEPQREQPTPNPPEQEQPPTPIDDNQKAEHDPEPSIPAPAAAIAIKLPKTRKRKSGDAADKTYKPGNMLSDDDSEIVASPRRKKPRKSPRKSSSEIVQDSKDVENITPKTAEKLPVVSEVEEEDENTGRRKSGRVPKEKASYEWPEDVF